MIVTLIALSVLAVWFQGINQVQEKTKSHLNKHTEKLAANKITSAVNTVCLLGKGNTRKIKVFFPETTKVSYNKKLRIGNYKNPTFCEVNADFQGKGSLFLLINHSKQVNIKIISNPHG